MSGDLLRRWNIPDVLMHHSWPNAHYKAMNLCTVTPFPDAEGGALNPAVFGLAIRTSRRIIRKASLMMSNLRTKGPKTVGWGYTNQSGDEQRE
jgi:hypothetical protein